MGLLKDLFSDDIQNKRYINETIEKLKYRVKELEDKEKYQNDYIKEKMECIEKNFADQIAEKCYVRAVSEENLLYLLSEIRKHKKRS